MTILMVASGGGHLKQLHNLSSRLPFSGERIWAAPRNALSASLLHEHETVWLRYNGPRDIVGVLRNARILLSTLGMRRDIEAVVTTGANHGLAAYPLALLLGVPFYFIETAARVEAPSLSGKIAARLPKARCFLQYPHRETTKWRYAGSVFESFSRTEAEVFNDRGPSSVLVTVGAMEDVGFRRMVWAAYESLPANSSVVWQTGPTSLNGMQIDATPFISAEELERHASQVDLVISHAGVGSILTVLESGKVPILFPRYETRGEHVDNHQLQIARHLENLGLAVVVWDGDTLSHSDLLMAMRAKVENKYDAAPVLRLT